MLRQLALPTEAGARQGRELTDVCMHCWVYVHTHTRVTEWPLFPWRVPCVFPLVLTKPGNSSFSCIIVRESCPGHFFSWAHLHTGNQPKDSSVSSVCTRQFLDSFALVSGMLLVVVVVVKQLIKRKIPNTSNFALKIGVLKYNILNIFTGITWRKNVLVLLCW